MASGEKRCSCGNAMKVAAIDVGQRFKCPVCQAQSFERQTYDLDAELGGEDPLVYLVRRRVASDETRDVPIVGPQGLPAEQLSLTKNPSDRGAPTVPPPRRDSSSGEL